MPYLIYPSEYLNDCKYSENNELKLISMKKIINILKKLLL